MTAYYNEFDKNAAAWLRELCDMKLIANGEVDERSIVDVSPDDVRGCDRVHWFAGIAGWDLALQLAGWHGPVWTASLPCQPFSCAGKQLGKSDDRHLLPHFLELVNACKPEIIFGEQVPGAIKHGWLDDLCDAMEREGYIVRAAVLTAAGIGAPHIRQRLYWVAHADAARCHWRAKDAGQKKGKLSRIAKSSAIDGVDDTKNPNRRGSDDKNIDRRGDEKIGGSGLWCDQDWIYCRDGKHRPIKRDVEPCVIKMVARIPERMGYRGDTSIQEDADNTQEARVMRLRGYGNAICPQVAAEFIKSVMATI